MNFKKTIAKSLVVAMALGMVPVANLQTAKADVAITFDGATGIATATEAKFWGIAKEAKKEGKDTVKIAEKHYKITNVQELDGEIDLYAALKGKAGVLAVGVNAIPDTNWKILSLTAAESTFKVYYSASNKGVKGLTPANALGGSYGYLFASTGKQATEVNLDTDKEKIEVKLNDGNWKTLKEFFGNKDKLENGDDKNVNKKLKVLGQSGSSLSFRYKGTATTWASKESKVKIPTQAKAPNVKVDDVKNTTSIKKGMEYKVAENTPEKIAAANWTPYNETKALDFNTIKPKGDEAKKDYVLIVRTAATDKKIASKYTTVMLKKAADALAFPENLNGTSAKFDENKVTLELAVKYDINKGAVLTNNNADKAYEYAFGKEAEADKLKWNTLKAGTQDKKNTGTVKPTVVKIPHKNFSDAETHFFLRVAGVKQKGNEITLSGATAHKKMEFAAVQQTLKVQKADATTSATGASELTIANDGATEATLKLKKATATTLKVKFKIDNADKKGDKAIPKVKVTGVKGVTVKAGNLDTNGIFEVTVDVKAFKETPSGTAKLTFNYESLKDKEFSIKIEEKN